VTHWATQYIGEPWVAHHHDCWGFFRRVQRERFGLELPEIDIDACAPLVCRRTFAAHDERKQWELVETPQEGDGVLMGKNRRPAHVGVWIETPEPAVLHCVEGAGVVVQDRAALKAAGWNVLGLYRRIDHE
jgi:hypothetical protein